MTPEAEITADWRPGWPDVESLDSSFGPCRGRIQQNLSSNSRDQSSSNFNFNLHRTDCSGSRILQHIKINHCFIAAMSHFILSCCIYGSPLTCTRASITNQQNLIRPKLHYFDLLWICWTPSRKTSCATPWHVGMLWTCCRLSVKLRTYRTSCCTACCIVVRQIHSKSKQVEVGHAVARRPVAPCSGCVSIIPRLHDEADGSTSWLYQRSSSSFVNVCNITPFKWPDSQLIKPALRAHDERSSCARRALVEPARRASFIV